MFLPTTFPFPHFPHIQLAWSIHAERLLTLPSSLLHNSNFFLPLKQIYQFECEYNTLLWTYCPICLQVNERIRWVIAIELNVVIMLFLSVIIRVLRLTQTNLISRMFFLPSYIILLCQYFF